MKPITRQMIAPVINSLRDPFDAHMVEKRILRIHPEAFARELLAYSQTGGPLLQFSAHFAKRVDFMFRGQITKTQKVFSNNLAGDSIKNQEWRRINPSNPVT
jgi:hypothetical protein